MSFDDLLKQADVAESAKIQQAFRNEMPALAKLFSKELTHLESFVYELKPELAKLLRKEVKSLESRFNELKEEVLALRNEVKALTKVEQPKPCENKQLPELPNNKSKEQQPELTQAHGEVLCMIFDRCYSPYLNYIRETGVELSMLFNELKPDSNNKSYELREYFSLTHGEIDLYLAYLAKRGMIKNDNSPYYVITEQGTKYVLNSTKKYNYFDKKEKWQWKKLLCGNTTS